MLAAVNIDHVYLEQRYIRLKEELAGQGPSQKLTYRVDFQHDPVVHFTGRLDAGDGKVFRTRHFTLETMSEKGAASESLITRIDFLQGVQGYEFRYSGELDERIANEIRLLYSADGKSWNLVSKDLITLGQADQEQRGAARVVWELVGKSGPGSIGMSAMDAYGLFASNEQKAGTIWVKLQIPSEGDRTSLVNIDQIHMEVALMKDGLLVSVKQ